MSKNLYIGNLAYSVTKEDLSTIFSEYGKIRNTTVIEDRETGRSRGFGFVNYYSHEEGEQALEKLDGTEYDGRKLVVRPAYDNKKREPK